MKLIAPTIYILTAALTAGSFAIAAPGNLLWTYQTGNCIVSSPAASGGLVYVGSNDRKIYCVHADTGQLAWSHQVISAVYSSPAVSNGYVYIGSEDRHLYCLNAQTGSQRWAFFADGWFWSSPAIHEGRVYVGCNVDNVYCLDANTGGVIWSCPMGGHVVPAVAVWEDHVYAGSYYEGRIYCLNASTGSPEWYYPTGGWIHSSPGVSEGIVYAGSNDGYLYCLDAITGLLIWSFDTHGGLSHCSPAISGPHIYVGSNSDYLYCLNAHTGSIVWSYQTGGNVVSSPAVSGGYVYVGSEDGKVYCFDRYNGDVCWSYQTGARIYASSPAVSGGRLYIGSDDGKLYCLQAGADDPGEWPMFRHDLLRTGEHAPVPQFESSTDVEEGWWMLSLPGIPTDWNASAVLSDAVAAGNVLEQNLHRYYPGVGYETYSDHFQNLESGRGYWLWISYPCTVCMTGSRHYTEQSIPLGRPWNLIGHPFDAPVPLASCRVSDGVEEKTYDEAIAAGWVGAAVYCYDSGYVLVRTSGGEDQYLRPWRGYWLRADEPGLTLIIPAP